MQTTIENVSSERKSEDNQYIVPIIENNNNKSNPMVFTKRSINGGIIPSTSSITSGLFKNPEYPVIYEMSEIEI